MQNEHSSGVDRSIAAIAKTLSRLDQRRHVSPARLEVCFVQEPLRHGWVAQIMADPLTRPVAGFGASAGDALAILADNIDAIDWRRVKR